MTSSTPSGYYLYTTSTTGYVNPHAVVNLNGTVYSYDNNGNLTSDATWTHTWDYRNRLTQSTKTGATTTYGYDHNNMRVKMVTASTTTIIPFPTYSTENGTAVKYISANGQLIATLRGTGTSTVAYYAHPDHLNSADKVTDNGGSPVVVSYSDYFPYGAVRQDVKTSPFENRRGYIGQDYDEDTGLNQLGARYAKSTIGRFISQDPVFWERKQNLENPQSLNSYSYGNNNPITNKDPDGRFAVGACGGGSAGATGLYTGGSTCGVVTFSGSDIQWGTIVSVEGGGSTNVLSAGYGGGLLISNAETFDDFGGADVGGGVSAKAGLEVGADVRVSKKKDGSGNVATISVSGGLGGVLTPYGVPVEVHGGVGYTKVVSSGSVRQSVANAVNYVSNQIAAIQQQINDLRTAIYQFFGGNSSGSSNNTPPANNPSNSPSQSTKKSK